MTGLDPSVSLCLSSSVHPAFVSFVPLSSRPEASSDDRRTEGDEGCGEQRREMKVVNERLTSLTDEMQRL